MSAKNQTRKVFRKAQDIMDYYELSRTVFVGLALNGHSFADDLEALILEFVAEGCEVDAAKKAGATDLYDRNGVRVLGSAVDYS